MGRISYSGLAEVEWGEPGARAILCRVGGGRCCLVFPFQSLPRNLWGSKKTVADGAPLAGARERSSAHEQTAFALADFSGKQM